MNSDEIVEELKETSYYEITSQQVEILAALSPEEYKQVVSRLLKEPVEDLSNLRGQVYRNMYRHRVLGCFLAALQPCDDLYRSILLGALGIADPTSIKFGALALSLIKPIELIVSDLLEIAYKSINNKEVINNIAGLFYWLGFDHDGNWHHRQITLDSDYGVDVLSLYVERKQPVSNDVKVANFAKQVSEFMR